MEETLRTSTFVKYSRDCVADRCVVFDADDTLCTFDQELRLGGCDKFEPRETELNLALTAAEEGSAVIIATARPCWTARKTLKWLRTHNVPVSALYLKNRANWDVTAHDLKVGMLEDIQRTWRVECFYDDSPMNVAAARSIGVNASYVEGNREYWTRKAKENGWVLPPFFTEGEQ
jgi:FMN phosphatase YigB (HAD superfamily)